MPRRIQLPDGRWIYVPDVDPYIEQIISGPPPIAGLPFRSEDDDDDDEGTLLGSALEGIKSFPGGIADIFLSGAQAAIGVATPFADLPVEQRLRKQASKRARERDPAYRDAFLPAVGTGLGQVAGLSALSRLPYGQAAVITAGVGMGISEQTRRIADYEQRTGTNVPWYKESAAHMMGALIGLSEVIPIKFGMYPTSVKNMMGRMKAGFTPNALSFAAELQQNYGIRDAVGMGFMEAVQEASANFLQSVSARGLYDPNAMEDLGRSMAEDFKVGGVVGGIAKLVQHQIIRSKLRFDSAEAEYQRGRYRNDEAAKDILGNIAGISETLLPIFRDLNVDKSLADEITSHFGDEYSAIPFGMDELLKSGDLQQSQVEDLVLEFKDKADKARSDLDEQIKFYSERGDIVEVKKYEAARTAVEQLASERLEGLQRVVTQLDGGLGDVGGLSGDPQYKDARRRAVRDAEAESVVDIQVARSREGDYRKKPSYLRAMQYLMGGSFGMRGLIRFAEILGVHKGPLSEQINLRLSPDQQTIPDQELASSDQANFSAEDIGRILFSTRGEHELTTDEEYVDRSDVMGGLRFLDSVRADLGGPQRTEARRTLKSMNERLEELQRDINNLQKNYAITRDLAERKRKGKYESEQEWIEDRDNIRANNQKQLQSTNAEIAKINRDKGTIYLRLLSERLIDAERHFKTNIGDKRKATRRVFGKPGVPMGKADLDRFDQWLRTTINTVLISDNKSQKARREANEKLKEFELGLAQMDATDADKEAQLAKFISENSKRYIQFPNDISAPQLIKIADLFIDDAPVRKEGYEGDERVALGKEDPRRSALEEVLNGRALRDISDWKTKDEMYTVRINGIPDVSETKPVLDRFLDRLVKALTNGSGNISAEETIRLLENPGIMPKDLVSSDDIAELLWSKNIFLRDEKIIGKDLAKRTGTGVESSPFKKLLFDMTGAPDWDNASYEQRLLMYSRLLQLPSHFRSRASPEAKRFLVEQGVAMGAGAFRPLFLPDFYHNPSIDRHIDFMTDEVVALTEDVDSRFPSRAVGKLRAQTKRQLGKAFNEQSFNEALARLRELEVFKSTSEPVSKVKEGSASRFDQTRVRFNIEWGPMDAPWVEEIGVKEPEDMEVREGQRWARNTDLELARNLLADQDAAWAKRVDDLWAKWNKENPNKHLTRNEFIEAYTPILTSATTVQELSDLGILDSVRGASAMPGIMAPTESILGLETSGGRRLVRDLMKAGALPSSLRDNTHAFRRRYIDTLKIRFETLGKTVEKIVARLKLPDNVKIQYVDAIDGLFQFMSEVAIRGEKMEGTAAIYDRPGNRIIINLAEVDPNNMVDAQQIIADATFHEGLHGLFIRHHFAGEEKDQLFNFARNENNIVPEEIDKVAHDAGLSWFKRAVVAFKDSELSEADIEMEAAISLLENLVRFPKAFDVYEKGKKVRQIGKGVRGFIEQFVGAAKDADIIDVMKILSRVERGEIGDRGAGYLGSEAYTQDSIIRSDDLMRYANPKDIEELKAAIVLRDAAPSGQMIVDEQAKVDAIVDKIIENRGAIWDSAPPLPDAVKALENQRKLIQDSRDTHSGSLPLISLDQSKKDSEAYKIALDTFMEMRGRDPRYAYKMPAPYQTFFDNKNTADPEQMALVERAERNGTLEPIDADVTRKDIENGVLGGYNPESEDSDGMAVGDDPSATASNVERTVNKLRFQWLDRRQYDVEMTDRLLAAQNRAQLDAETSAIVMWRNSDNALNWLPGLMLRGPLSYLGVSVGSGKFENTPVYDDGLQEKYGDDGRVRGLNDIIGPIIGSKDQQLALLYGIAKRVQWTKNRLDSIRSSVANISPENFAPEVRRELEMFEESYKDIREGVKETDAELDQIVRIIEGKPSGKYIIEFWDRYHAFDNHMIKMAHDTGMITREQRDEWLSMPWTPFYRDTVDQDENFPMGNEEIKMRGTNMVEKALKGSMKPITSKLANSLITNAQALVRDAMMNVAVSRMARDKVALGEAEKVSISGMAASVDDKVVRVMENGVPVFYRLDDAQHAMAAMMLGFNPKKQLQEWFGEGKLGKGAQKALTGASSLLRESVTRTLAFAEKNVFRDSWTAMSITGGGPELVLEAFRNAFNVDSLRRADEAGLSIGIDFVAEPGEYGKQMEKELKKANLDWKNPIDAFAMVWHLMGRMSKQSEVATRLAVYDRVLAQTGDKALAQHYAIEIMNYGRRGASPTLSTYMATIPFMNGRLQGSDVTYRSLRSKKGSSDVPGTYGYGLTTDEYADLPWWQKNRAQIIQRGLVLSASTAVLYMLMREDDEWQDLRDEVKSDNWVLPMSDHAWLKIPIPFEIGVLFKVIPEKLVQAVMEKEVSAVDIASETKRQIQATLGVAGLPQLIAPIVGAMRNYDAFRKDTIVDPWMEETISPNEQRSIYTSNVARSIADFANSIPLVKEIGFLTSPMKVEYMARQWGGTNFGYLTLMADRLARTGVLPDIPFDPWMNMAEAESVIGTNKDFDWKSFIGAEGVANVPILGDLLTDPRTRGGRQQQFFKMIEELDTVVATLSSITERDYEKGFEYRRKHMNILKHQRQLRFLQNQLEEWRERRDHLGRVSARGDSFLFPDEEGRAAYQRLLESRQSILTSVDDLMASIKSGTA